MSGSLVRSDLSTRTPLSTSSPAASASWVRGRTPDADHHRVGPELLAEIDPDAGRRDLGDLRAEPQVDAVLAVQLGEHLAHLRAEHAEQRQLGRLEHHDVGARLAGGGGDLEADPTGADDDQPLALPEGGPDPVGVGMGAQGQRRVRARDGQRARLRAGGQDQGAVRQPGAVGQLDLVRSAVDRGHHGAAAQVDVVLGVPRLGVHDRLVELVLAGQVALGQRRPLVGQLVLGGEQGDRSVVALLAERLGGLGPGQAPADDHDAVGSLSHVCLPSW